ncbi:uncharacterized protein LOC107363240 [Tetranychus urticae]|uniref:Uncharacterized protein n=1 Tax=Tetranychus urticae TaxID=32264 RepID=T1KDH3_TETUR|nr:uncharacterized protein LOC107363240 [Tetranychus urticae]XP_015785921.1 uncharacterized protein LOC107363240 [Tetranychus urticae]
MKIKMKYLLQLGLITILGIGGILSLQEQQREVITTISQQHVQNKLPIPIDGSGEAVPIPIHTSHEDVISLPLRAPPPLLPPFPTETISIQGSGSSVVLTDDDLERLEKERTRNVVRLAATDQLNSEIITNRTRAYLSCESGEMIVKINFSVPFRGVAYANYDRSSNCKFYGDGSQYYEMRIPLKGCGTKQEAPRLFINNIIFRFHRSLELEEDEIKTIICRYPPPLAPPPADPLPPIVEPVAPVPLLVPNKLSEIELLLIICALLFLTLLLLGVGCGYYCLKRRNIKIVRKKRHLTPAPSEITKVSSIIDTIRIPRVTAPPTESSETDYPSESPSDDDGRRTIVSETSTLRQDRYRFENAAFLPEPYPLDIERGDSVSSFPVPAIYRPEIIKRDLCTTIVETENLTDEDEFTTRYRAAHTKLYQKQPTYSDAPSLRGSIPDDDDWSHSEIIEKSPTKAYVKPKVLTTENLEDTYVDRNGNTEIIEDSTRNKLSVVPAPKILVKNIDDLYVTNISETVTTESIFKESGGRSVDQTKAVKAATKSTSTGQQIHRNRMTSHTDVRSSPGYQVERTRELLDVYQDQESETSRFDESKRQVNRSVIRDDRVNDRTDDRMKSRLSSQETTATMSTGTKSLTKQYIEDENISKMSDSYQHRSSTLGRSKSNVILNILENPPQVQGIEQLSSSDRTKWRTTVVTDEVFRSLIIESTTVDEYVRISRDIRYEKLFSANTWETIVRILTHPSVANLSLGTEEDFNAEWSETLYRIRPERKLKDLTGSTRSSWTADYDLRSITEEDVNFTRLHKEASSWSESGQQIGIPPPPPPPPPPTIASTTTTVTTTDVPIKSVSTSKSYQQTRSSGAALSGSRVEERSSRSMAGYYSASSSSNIRSHQQR